MVSDLLNFIDHNYIYRGLASFYYFIYLLLIFDLPQNKVAIFPSPLLLIITNIILFILVLCAQEVEPTNQEDEELLKWVLLSLIPPLLGVYFLYSWIMNKRKQEEQLFIILGPVILGIVMGVIAIGQIGLIIISLFIGSFGVLYIPFTSLLGFLGVILGDKYSQITEIDIKNSLSPNYYKYFNYLLTKIVGTHTNRMISTLIWLILLFLIFIFRGIFSPIVI